MEYGTTGYEGFRKGIQNQKKPFLKSFHDALCDDALCDDALCEDALRGCLATMPCDDTLRRCFVQRCLVRRCLVGRSLATMPCDDALCDDALCDDALCDDTMTMPCATMPCATMPWDNALGWCLVTMLCLSVMMPVTMPCYDAFFEDVLCDDALCDDALWDGAFCNDALRWCLVRRWSARIYLWFSILDFISTKYICTF